MKILVVDDEKLLVLLIVIWAKKLRPQSRYGSRRNKNKGFRNYRGRRR